MIGPPHSLLTTEELIARRATALQKRADDVDRLRSAVYSQRLQEANDFEQRNLSTTRDFNAEPGTLVLLRNTAIEKSLNRKMRARYLGPYLVVSRNRGGAYILSELDGAVFDRPVAAFRVLPYLARRDKLAFQRDFLDADSRRIRELEASTDKGDGAADVDTLQRDGVANP